MKDTENDPPIIEPPGSGLVLRKLRLDRRPRLITQPKHALINASVAIVTTES